MPSIKSILTGLLFALLVVLIGVPAASAQSGMTSQNGPNFTCASDDGGRHYCRVDTSQGVRMTYQRSGSPCIQGQTYGWDRRGVWVDRGCRADFLLGGYNRPGIGNGAGWNGGGYPPPGNGGGGTLTCSSNDGRRNYCSANLSGRGVRLVNQRSGSPCVQGQTWGYNNRGIWVDRGCRADFAIGR